MSDEELNMMTAIELCNSIMDDRKEIDHKKNYYVVIGDTIYIEESDIDEQGNVLLFKGKHFSNSFFDANNPLYDGQAYFDVVEHTRTVLFEKIREQFMNLN